MRTQALLASLAFLNLGTGFQFQVSPQRVSSSIRSDNAKLYMSINENENNLDRRSILGICGGVLAGPLFAPIAGAEESKVVVMGGAGYVGSRVSVALADKGFNVVSVSRSSPSDQAAKSRPNTGKSPAIKFESLDATKDDLSEVMKGASAVVSCVGIPPWEKSTAREGNGLANMRISDAAKAAGVDKFVYVSVAKEFSSGPAKLLFGEYFKGKAEADSTVVKNFGDKAVFVKPGFIDGAPPGEIRPPGPPGLAAISPDAVANAAVAGVLGKLSGSADGYDAIMAVAK